MSKHRMVDGRLLQMNKRYGQLKQKQKEKISGWMYEAFRKQATENLSDEEALQLVFSRIEDSKIWIPEEEIIIRYRAKKSQFRKRLAGENVPQHIYAMENILDKATYMMDTLEKIIAEYEEFQSAINKLEAYYTSQQWKDDYAMDEAGKYPEKLKRGVLSQDAVWNMNEEISELISSSIIS